MAHSELAAVILAAGQGTRMKSALHKVLHPVGGKALVSHLLDTVATLKPAKTVLVVGDNAEQLTNAIHGVDFASQDEQLGTGHAVQCALPALSSFQGDILVLYGDVPFVAAKVMQSMLDTMHAADNCGLVVLGFRADDPAAYGRLIVGSDGSLERIVEFKDASAAERAVNFCNSGIMLISGAHAAAWLKALSCDNAAGEYYLTDLVAIARAAGVKVAHVETGEADLIGVNSRSELASAEAIFQARARKDAMASGVTLVAPETVFFSFDTDLAPDVTIEPNVVFGPGVKVETGVTIKAFSHLEGATVRRGASIGPYARLRPAADIGEGAKIGNFVEIKKSRLAAGVKVSHLSYIGDTTIGKGSNIGAGTITCNYDGFLKYNTHIGAGAFIGSNSSLVAPVTIGDGAIVGAGSVMTKDVPDDALGVARAKQLDIKGYAAKFRAKKQEEKDASKSKKKG